MKEKNDKYKKINKMLDDLDQKYGDVNIFDDYEDYNETIQFYLDLEFKNEL